MDPRDIVVHYDATNPVSMQWAVGHVYMKLLQRILQIEIHDQNLQRLTASTLH